MDEKEIYKLALKAKDSEIDSIDKEIDDLKTKRKILTEEREQIRLKTRSELQVFIEKYPGLSPSSDKDITEFRAKYWITKSEKEILAEIDRVKQKEQEYLDYQSWVNSPG